MSLYYFLKRSMSPLRLMNHLYVGIQTIFSFLKLNGSDDYCIHTDIHTHMIWM